MEISGKSDSNLTHLRVTGRIDASTSQNIDDAVDAALADGGRNVIFDLQEVNYVSSAGLRAFVRATKKAKAAGGGVAIFGLHAAVAEIFAVAGFDRIIPIVATEVEAKQKLQG